MSKRDHSYRALNPWLGRLLKPTSLFGPAACAVALLLSWSPVHAANITWSQSTAGSSYIWTGTTNWVGGAVPGNSSSSLGDSTDVAIFGTLTGAETTIVDATRYIGGITFQNAGGSGLGYTLSTGGLFLNNGGVIQTTSTEGAHNDTISSLVTIDGNGGSATFTSGGSAAASVMTFSGGVTGVAASGKTNTLTLNGTVGGPSSASTISGNITDGSGGGALALVKSGSGQWWVNSSASAFTGGTTVSGGTLGINVTPGTPLGAGPLTIAGGTVKIGNSSARSFTLGGLVAAAGGGNTLIATIAGNSTVTLNVPTGASYNYGGQLGGSSASAAANAIALTMATGTGTQTLSGNNYFNGAVTVNAGTLQLGSANALGFGGSQTSTTAGTTVGSGATLELNGTTGVNEPITISGTGIGANGALINSSSSTAIIDNGIAGLTFSSAGSGIAGSAAITFSGTGASAAATPKYGLTAASITGLGYTTASGWVVGDLINITGGGGSGAIAYVAAVSGGVPTSVNFTGTGSNPGSGFTTAPTGWTKNTSTSGTVTGGTLTANANNFTLISVAMTAAGSGYAGTTTAAIAGATPPTLTPTLSSVTLAAASSIGGSGNLTINAVVAGAFPLTKVGAGTLTLTGINTYSGTTTVSGGTLAVSSAQSGGGAFAVNDGTTLNVNRDSTTTALATSALTLGSSTGATLGFSLPAGNPAAQVITAGSLTLNGTTTVVISGSTFSLGQFHLIKYTGTIGGSGSFNTTATMPAGYQASIVNTGNGYIDLNVTSAPITWEGYSSGNWNTSDLNWTNGTAAAAYADGDGVTFDDTAAVSTLTNVNLIGTLQPASVIVNNSLLPYEFSGSGSIAGSSPLTKQGTSSLTIATANTFSGGTTIGAGTLQLGDGSSANGSVGSGSIVNNAALIVANPSGQTIGNAISGTGTLTKQAAGTATLTGVNSYSGLTTVNAGELDLNATGGTAVGGNVLVSGGTAKLLQAGQINSAKNLTVSSGTFDIQSYNQTLGGVQVTGGNLNGTGGGTLTSTTAYDLQAGSVGVILGGTAAMNKTTTGTVTLSGANTATNTVTISAGTLTVGSGGAINANSTAAGGLVTVANTAGTSAMLNLSGGTVNATKTGAPSLSAGTASGAVGIINLSSGTLSTTADAWLGAGAAGINGFGALNMTGGSANFGNYLAVGRSSAANGQSRGELIMSGGNLTVNNNSLEIGSFQNYQTNTSVATLSGNANLTIASSAAYLTVASAQNGILNLLPGSEQVNILSASGLIFARNAANETGIVNLNGGTITTPTVIKGTQAGAVGYFNFNGGTLKANKTTTTFMTNLTAAYVYGGGAVIDDGGFTITVAQPLLSPTTGNGVSTNGLTVSGSGFLVPPIVDIIPDPSDTTGVGASAIATIDGGGNLTGVVMTSAGVNYTAPPSFMFTGGGGNVTLTTATGGTAANTSGGLTKNGAGTLTLSGTNTYTGATTVNAGTLSIGAAGQLGGGSYAANITNNGTFNYGSSAAQTIGGIISGPGALTVSGSGTLTLSGANAYAGATTIGAGKLLADVADGAGTGALGSGGNITFTGGTLQYDANSAGTDWSARFKNSTSAIALNDGGQTLALANAIDNSNTGGLTKSGAGTITLSGANTYSGVTTVSAGTLKNGSSTTFSGTGGLAIANTAGAVFDLNGYNAMFSTNSIGGAAAMITNSNPGTTAILNLTNQSASSIATLLGGNLTLKITGGLAGSPWVANNLNTFSGGLTLLNSPGTGNRLRIINPFVTAGSPGAITSGPFGTGAITVGLAPTDKVGMNFATTTNELMNDVIMNTALGNDVPGIRLDVDTTFSGTLTANQADILFSVSGSLASTAKITGRVTGSQGLKIAPNTTTSRLAVNLNHSGTPNDYAGPTTISATNATLTLGAADQIPNGAGKGNVTNNGTLNLNGFNETINGLFGGGIVDGASGTPTFTVGDNNQSSAFTGFITNTAGALALTKIGTGTLTLSGANTYTGNTTISAGELIGQTGGSCANTTVSVSAGATNGVSVAAANGQWSCNGLIYSSGTTYADFNFQSFAPSTSVAPLNVGGLTVNGTVNVLLRNVTIPAVVGTNYPLIHYTGADPAAGSFKLNGVITSVTNAACGLVVDSVNKAVSVGVQLFVPNLALTNAPGISRIITTNDLVAAGLVSAQSNPNYTITVGTPANGGSAITNSGGTMIRYANATAAAGSTDSFSYTVSDGVSSATATVTVNFAGVTGPALTSGTDGNGHAVIHFNALPDYTYHMQHATTLSPADWTNLLNAITVPSNGAVTWTNFESNPADGFYRLTYP